MPFTVPSTYLVCPAPNNQNFCKRAPIGIDTSLPKLTTCAPVPFRSSSHSREKIETRHNASMLFKLAFYKMSAVNSQN